MICQVTLDDCKNNCAGKCHFLTGQASPPPPTLEDIDRLMDALVDAAIYSDVPDAQAARAALMAAIRLYGRE